MIVGNLRNAVIGICVLYKSWLGLQILDRISYKVTTTCLVSYLYDE